MYQLLCHVNVPVPASGQGNFRFCPWYGADSSHYYKILWKLQGFWDNTGSWLYILFTISNREAETAAIFSANDVWGELGRVRNKRRFI